MIGLDTNVLIRYLAQDDARQSARATEIFERELSVESPGYVSLPAMVETAWVLERSYDLGKADLAAVIEKLLQSEVLVVACAAEVFTAMIAVREGQGRFADALIAALGAAAGCSHTLTFDRKAQFLAGFAAA